MSARPLKRAPFAAPRRRPVVGRVSNAAEIRICPPEFDRAACKESVLNSHLMWRIILREFDKNCSKPETLVSQASAIRPLRHAVPRRAVQTPRFAAALEAGGGARRKRCCTRAARASGCAACILGGARPCPTAAVPAEIRQNIAVRSHLMRPSPCAHCPGGVMTEPVPRNTNGCSSGAAPGRTIGLARPVQEGELVISACAEDRGATAACKPGRHETGPLESK